MAIQILPEEFPPVCSDCGEPLQVDIQTLTHSTVTLHTCKNRTCLLRDVTLEADVLLHMSAERAESYRAVNRQRDGVCCE